MVSRATVGTGSRFDGLCVYMCDLYTLPNRQSRQVEDRRALSVSFDAGRELSSALS